jgi:hypothetical protein
MKTILIILPLVLISFICRSQTQNETKTTIAITARSYADHIVLRYFATTPSLLNTANKVGYVIERAVFKDGIPVEKLSYTPVKGSPFLRWTDQQWDSALKAADKTDTTNIKLAGFAMTLSDSNVRASKGNVFDGGLKSLKEERDNQDMKFAFALIAANRSKMAAEGLALRITDNDVVLGTTYVYRIRINEPTSNISLESAYVKVKCERFNDKYLINNKAVIITEGDEKVSFAFPESKEYYAFNVERSDDGGVTYKKLTTTPTLKLKPHGYTGPSDYGYSDSSLVNYKKYYYRLFVSTLFADDLLFAEFIAMPRDKTPPPAPFLKSATHIKPTQVELIWETMGKKADDLKGFNIKRSDAIKGKYILISKSILPVSARKYTDESFDKDGTNYYIVEAVDTAGNISQSFPAYVTLIDSIPPAIPIISSARIDSVGKITIKVKPNIEKDFMGYQLLKANAKDHDFSVVLETFKDSLGRTTFTMYDSTTLNTLTKNIYFKVIAFDTHFNQSEPSKVIELKKRDTIPPVSPLITGYAINDTSVVISFANSSSEDAVRNILLRRESGKVKFDTAFSNTNIKVTRFIDKNIIGGRQYEYAMIAKDDGGLSSKISNSIQIKTLLNNRIPAPKLEGTYDPNTKKVSLNFIVDTKLMNRKLKIEIYKRDNKLSGLNIFKTIDFEKGKPFLDDPTDGQSGSNYTVRLTDENKKSSNFSNELELKFK